MSTPSSRRPLPPLPTETHAHVLSFCDDQTLGRACLVSLAFLELAGPILYQDVTITGCKQMERIFYSEPRTSSAPHLDRILSVNQARSFTFVGVPRDRGFSSIHPHPFIPSRSSTSFPIRIDSLDVRFIDPPSRLNDFQRHGVVATSLLALFNPIEVALSSSLGPDSSETYVRLAHVPWTRLRSLSLDEISPDDYFSVMPWYRSLPARSVTLIWLLRDRGIRGPPPPTSLISNAVSSGSSRRNPDRSIWTAWCSQVEEIVFKASSIDSADQVRNALTKLWRGGSGLHQVEEREIARRNAMIRYQIS